MNKDLDGEIWKDVVGFEGSYLVSNYGRIKSRMQTYRKWNDYFTETQSRILKGSIDRLGYTFVSLRKDGVSKKYSVHRLVALAFIPNPDNKDTVNHKDMSRSNNHVDNLEWMTQGENVRHAYENNKNRVILKGSEMSCSILTETDVSEIKHMYNCGAKLAHIAKRYNTNTQHIWSICNLKIWKHV